MVPILTKATVTVPEINKDSADFAAQPRVTWLGAWADSPSEHKSNNKNKQKPKSQDKIMTS